MSIPVQLPVNAELSGRTFGGDGYTQLTFREGFSTSLQLGATALPAGMTTLDLSMSVPRHGVILEAAS